jgi:hypothetical protein
MARRWREEGSEATPGSRPAVSQIADTKKHPSGCLLLFEVLVAGAGFDFLSSSGDIYVLLFECPNII